MKLVLYLKSVKPLLWFDLALLVAQIILRDVSRHDQTLFYFITFEVEDNQD